jgi:hypothetical protein
LLPRTVDDNIIIVDGLAYSPAKLTILSILWRTSVSSLREFLKIKLGPHGEALRQVIHARDLGQDTFRVYGQVIVYEKIEEVAHEIIEMPLRTRVNGGIVWSMVFGGVRWMVVMSKCTQIPAVLCLQPPGTFPLVKIRPEDLPSIAAQLRLHKKRRYPLPPR